MYTFRLRGPFEGAGSSITSGLNNIYIRLRKQQGNGPIVHR